MPYQTIGREITRGTICRDRYRAEVTLACSDDIPLGQQDYLLVQIRWREGIRPGQPEDAGPIVLSLRSLLPNAGGQVCFDSPNGTTEKSFSGDVTTLLTLHGKAASSGPDADVRLEVRIEGEERGALPLRVATPRHRLRIRAASGEAPQDLIPPHRAVPYRAVAYPPLAGQVYWRTLPDHALEIEGPADQPRVQVVGRLAPEAERRLCAWLVPPPDTTAPTLFAALPIALGEDGMGRAEAEAFAPTTAQVMRAGWQQGSASTGETVNLWVQTSGGQAGQKLTLEIMAVTITGAVPIEQIEVPLGDTPVLTMAWQVPTTIPDVGAQALGFSASLLDEPVVATDAETVAGQPGLRLYGQLQLRVPLQMQLVDSTGTPLANVAYRLTNRQGEVIPGMGGRTNASGEITLADLPSADYILQVDGATVLSATEPDPAVAPAVPNNTVFSLLDVRLDRQEVAP